MYQYGGGQYGSSYWSSKFDKVEKLCPHVANPKMELLDGELQAPIILLSPQAYMDTHYIMEESNGDEAAWLGNVKILPKSKDDDAPRYLIENIFLFNQDVSAGHCEFDQADIGKFYSDMLTEDPKNRDFLNSILFWGHVHPGSMVTPSQQDENQMELFAHNDYFIRGIFTRQKVCSFTFFDYKNGLKFVDCPWQLYVEESDERKKDIAQQMKEKVKRKSWGFQGKKSGGYSGGSSGFRPSPSYGEPLSEEDWKMWVEKD